MRGERGLGFLKLGNFISKLNLTYWHVVCPLDLGLSAERSLLAPRVELFLYQLCYWYEIQLVFQFKILTCAARRTMNSSWSRNSGVESTLPHDTPQNESLTNLTLRVT